MNLNDQNIHFKVQRTWRRHIWIQGQVHNKSLIKVDNHLTDTEREWNTWKLFATVLP